MNALNEPADYPESTVAIALQAFLSILSFSLDDPLTIELLTSAEERTNGADAVFGKTIKSVNTFYMQFKRPTLRNPNSKRPRADSLLSQLTAQRKAKKLDVNSPYLYFKLRDLSKKQQEEKREYQHNILLELINSGNDAAYVCPLFVRKQEYMRHMHLAAKVLLKSGFGVSPAIVSHLVQNVPFFSHHISIVPKTSVDHADHYYTFTVDGAEVVFHSPDLVSREPRLLSAWIRDIAEKIPIPIEEAVHKQRRVETLLSEIRTSLPIFEEYAQIASNTEHDEVHEVNHRIVNYDLAMSPDEATNVRAINAQLRPFYSVGDSLKKCGIQQYGILRWGEKK